MRYSLLTVVLASSASGSIFARTAQSILSDISTISTNVKALNDAINSYKGDVASAVPVTQAESNLGDAIKQGITDAKGTSEPLSDSDTTSILDAINSLIPEIISSVNAFVGQQAAFEKAGLGDIASKDLNSLQTDTTDFAAALISIAPSPSLAAASSAKSCIDAAFSSAVAGSTATSCGGAAQATTAPAGSSGTSSSSSPTTTSGVLAATTTSARSGSTSPTSTNAAATQNSGRGVLAVILPVVAVFAL
ncbi:hydrophobic surface binding protein A-domain-containing protein [Leptodontidium sp. 2 PMI_412]|nr:hydrophobic surface binding protein A-domain-containing protein [Leptodontidium sp. MPI-SDFR-AT-0119]KAH9217356.1 hydrophobic surface binding protein A-domain-containing protein [Leptodontidium sp. 2 PMI_412]